MANKPLRYRPDAVPTPLGWAHEKTGEQLTSHRNLEPAEGTEAYDPNNRKWMAAFNSEAPANTVAPLVSGSPVAGSTLTVSTGTWTGVPAPTFSYQWKVGASDIEGAVLSEYVTAGEEVGQEISCVVTATNSAGSVSAPSNAVTVTAA